jgi:hypothetical protein
MTRTEFMKTFAAIVLFGALVYVFIWAGVYNNSRNDLCSEHGMVPVREYPFGEYGCATLVPYEDLD